MSSDGGKNIPAISYVSSRWRWLCCGDRSGRRWLDKKTCETENAWVAGLEMEAEVGAALCGLEDSVLVAGNCGMREIAFSIVRICNAGIKTKFRD